MKKLFLLSTILLLLFAPVQANAISKENAEKMNNYIFEAIFNNEWNLSTDSVDNTRYNIRVDFTRTDAEFLSVVDSASSASIFLYDCVDYSDGDSCLANKNNLPANENYIIDFSLEKDDDGNPYLYAIHITNEAYQNISDGLVYFYVETGNVEKEGVSFINSSFNGGEVNNVLGTYSNPDIIGIEKSITIPSAGSDVWKGQTNNLCYYFKVDFSSVNSEKDIGRYSVSDIEGEEYARYWVISWFLGGVSQGNVLRDAFDTDLVAFNPNNIYGICAGLSSGERFYGRTVTFTYQDSENVNLSGANDVLNGQVDDQYVNSVDGGRVPPYLEGDATGDNWDQPIGCEDIFKTNEEGSVGWILMTLLNYVRVIGPIAVVLLSALDFIKAIMSSDEKAMKQAQSKLVIRLIAALALFLIPTLIDLLLDLINAENCANTLG